MDNYPNGGTPPTIHQAVQHAHTALPYTGSESVSFLLLALVVLAVGLTLWGIARFGRSHV